jgi:lipoate-protein ligase A
MKQQEWRLIKTKETDGAMQMAIDEAILTARIQNRVPNTLRFFTWNPPCLTIGYFQSLVKEVNITKAREKGVDIVRRYTGGGAVYHDKELTYSIALAEKDIPSDIIESYQTICNGIIEGLHTVGIEAAFHPINDILVNGKKISGNAQTRRNNVSLQHGTILLDVDIKAMFSLLKVSDEKIRDKMIQKTEERVTTVQNELEKKIDRNDLRVAIIKGFQNIFGVTFKESELTAYEQKLAETLYLEKYANPDWTERR